MNLVCYVLYSVPLLGAILHYLYDFAFEWHEDGGDYTVTNYEVGVMLLMVTMVTPITCR